MEKLSSEVKSFTRNPLGVIGLFIFLVHAVGAGILGVSIDKLAPHNQSLLVFFVIVFPFIVLGFFGWMVAWHHDKFYGPGDFQSDKSYLEYASRSNVGWRTAAEFTQAAPSPQDEAEPTFTEPDSGANGNAESEPAPSPASESEPIDRQDEQRPSVPTQAASGFVPPNVSAYMQSPGSRVQTAYLAESLVFNELERETGAAVRRNIRIQARGHSFEVDGLLERNGERTAVEVKFVGIKMLRKVSREAFDRMARLTQIPDSGISNVVVAFVVSGTAADLQRAHRIIHHESELPPGFRVRVYSFEGLLADYGLMGNGAQPT